MLKLEDEVGGEVGEFMLAFQLHYLGLLANLPARR